MDPIVRDVGASQAWNGYAYVEGRVTAWTDPSGYVADDSDSKRAVQPVAPYGTPWLTLDEIRVRGSRDPGASFGDISVPRDLSMVRQPRDLDRGVDAELEEVVVTGDKDLNPLCSAKNAVAGAVGGAVAAGAATVLSGKIHAVPVALIFGATTGLVVGVFADQPGIVGFVAGGFTAVAVAAASGGSFGDVLAVAVGATVPAGAASVPAGALLGAMTGALPNSPARTATASLGRIGGAVVGSTAGAQAAALEVAIVALVIGAFDNAFGCRE